MMAVVYLSLGSNMGKKDINIRQALDRLAKIYAIKHISPFYLTEPIGFKDQEWFVNCAVEMQTEDEPRRLLSTLQSIETEMGRVKTEVNGPRIIDIDILFYDDCIIHTKNLTIPHPRIQDRLFVLRPLMDLNPGFVHPTLKKTIQQLYEEQPKAKVVMPYTS
jgi:2-amino-4-hydroxy-6-hydroxymethyldihydropteridine diphosphokinase